MLHATRLPSSLPWEPVHAEAVREEEDPQFGWPWPEVVVDAHSRSVVSDGLPLRVVPELGINCAVVVSPGLELPDRRLI
jgi:hypothetical protein